uniref:Uncharacterized protein n=1 Tax=Triticum urartu TaxID=4572 RepID=A0A8R7R7I4_TRIUA
SSAPTLVPWNKSSTHGSRSLQPSFSPGKEEIHQQQPRVKCWIDMRYPWFFQIFLMKR